MCVLPATQSLSVIDSLQILSLQEKKTTTCDLLTPEVLKETTKSVKEYQQTYALGIGALQAVCQTVEVLTAKVVNLECFDGLLGDRACQIRAAVVAHHYLKLKPLLNRSLVDTIQAQIKRLQEKQAELRSKNPHLCFDKTTKGALLKKEGDVEIAPELVELTQLYLLQEVKEFKPKTYTCHDCQQAVTGFREETNIAKIATYFHPDQVSLKGLVNRTKASVCQSMLVKFCNLASFVSDPMTLAMLADKNIKTINGKPELPCYYTVQGLVDIALKQKLALFIKVKSAHHSVEPDPNLPFDVNILVKTCPIEPDAPIVVIEAIKGTREFESETAPSYEERLLKHDIYHLIKLCAAHHPQYSDNGGLEAVALLQTNSDERQKLEGFAKEAIALGCCPENMRLFSITHIFCDTLASQLLKKEKAHAK